ncbi:hypothetical protein SRHO_G00121430 [Serrasalmus rhombeus]
MVPRLVEYPVGGVGWGLTHSLSQSLESINGRALNSKQINGQKPRPEPVFFSGSALPTHTFSGSKAGLCSSFYPTVPIKQHALLHCSSSHSASMGIEAGLSVSGQPYC